MENIRLSIINQQSLTRTFFTSKHYTSGRRAIIFLQPGRRCVNIGMIDYNSIRSKYINADNGFYSVGADIYFSKARALLRATETKLPILFHFNEPEYSTFAWHQEPKETLDELYANRAREIRDTHDYVIALYSGGADSQNMIDTFIDNAIPLDHVISWGAWNRHVDKKNNIMNQEVMIAANDTIKKIIQQDIKFTHINYIDFLEHSFKNTDWILGSGPTFAPYEELIVESVFLNNDFVRLGNKGKKICMLWAREKPYLKLIEGTYYVQFYDMAFLECTGCNNSIKQIFFYSDKNTAKLIAKQAHLIIQHLEKHYPEAEIYKILNDSRSVKTLDLVNKICYKKFRETTFSVGKPLSMLYPKKWQWFWGDTSTEQFKIWKGAMVDLHKSVSANLKTTFDPVAKRMTFTTFHNRYPIKKFKIL